MKPGEKAQDLKVPPVAGGKFNMKGGSLKTFYSNCCARHTARNFRSLESAFEGEMV